MHTSLYRRLLLRAIEGGARTATVGRALHSRIRRNPGEGSSILKFLHGQYYTGKLAKRFGHSPSDACVLCGLPDSCTHVAGECMAHHSQIISKHNAACQLTHAAIRKAFKGGAALHSPYMLNLVSADTGSKSQTQGSLAASLQGSTISPPDPPPPTDWLAPEPSSPPATPTAGRPSRQVDVTADIAALLQQQAAAAGDGECTAAPSYIPDWVLPAAEQQNSSLLSTRGKVQTQT